MATTRTLVFTAGGITEEARDADTQIVSGTIRNNSGSLTVSASATSMVLKVAGTTLLSIAAGGIVVSSDLLPVDDAVHALGSASFHFSNVWSDEVDSATYNSGGSPMGFNAANISSTTAPAFNFSTGSGNVGQLSNNGILAQQVGADLASASTITPTHAIHRVTGTTSINTITVPDVFNDGDNTGGHLTIIPTGIFTWTASGNIGLAGTSVVGKAIIFTWMPGLHKWYPSATS